ncbi:GNAT family N-acetyltransferase [Microvirga flavescens]|uniref:GNAT family N-acetyltransferase n=1 Tax=Microvirga flavescens TaxID=2249811 RepID=UPI000DD81745|nr:N-acetyltransferase [Microvirga flavescens]
MITIREENFRDVEARETLLDTCFGPARFQKTCERLREGRRPADGLALAADEDGVLVGTVRLWHVSAGPQRPALMLGPIAVDPSRQSCGLGARLMREALSRAAALGHKAVVLVGDAPYYERFGFSSARTENLWLPGPYERERFLGLELQPGALESARGLVSATGAPCDRADLAALVASAANDAFGSFRHSL